MDGREWNEMPSPINVLMKRHLLVGVKRLSRPRALICSLSALEDVKNALEQINGGEE